MFGSKICMEYEIDSMIYEKGWNIWEIFNFLYIFFVNIKIRILIVWNIIVWGRFYRMFVVLCFLLNLIIMNYLWI